MAFLLIKGEQSFQIILKSIHKYRTSGLDKSKQTDGHNDQHTSKWSCDNDVQLTAIGLDQKKKTHTHTHKLLDDGYCNKSLTYIGSVMS